MEGDIVGIPKGIQRRSSYDEKVAEQLKSRSYSPFHVTSKPGTVPVEVPFQYDIGREKKEGFKELLLNTAPKYNSDWLPLATACFRGDLDEVKQLLAQKRTDVNAVLENDESPLIIACAHGNIAIVQLLIEHGAEINMVDTLGMSALMLASASGHFSITKLLLEHGAKPNVQNNLGVTALIMASGAHYSIVQLLLDYGAQPNILGGGFSALHVAVSMQQYSTVKVLLQKKANVNIKSASGTSTLFTACEMGLYEMAKLLLANGADLEDGSPLVTAARLGHHEVAKLLLDWGASVDFRYVSGQTALMGASYFGHYGLVELLLSRGALPNTTRHDGNTALMAACFGGHYRIVRLLLQNGAQPDLQNKMGQSALFITSSVGHYRVAEALIKAGAHVDLQDPSWNTALMIASEHGHFDIANLLIESGAEIDLQDSTGHSALLLAVKTHHYEVAKLLVVNGAQLNLQDADGFSALFISSLSGQYDISKLLVDRGAYINSKIILGETPLMASSSRGMYEVTKLLLKHGAKVNLQESANGYSPLALACRNWHYDVIKLLLEHGALVNLQDSFGNSPLHLLLARGAQPDLQNCDVNQYALTSAGLTRKYEITKLLLEAQVAKANLLRALQIAMKQAEDSAIIKLLLDRCLQVIRRNEILAVDSDFPGVVFWSAPIRQCITSQGATIEPPHTGISLSIPELALSSTEEDVDLLIHPCFSGPFELPEGYESASPTYLIQPSRKVEIQRDVILQIHHYASLQSREDREEMTFLSASPTPQYRQFKPVYVFKEISQSRGIFKTNSQVGEISTRHFCLVSTARRLKSHGTASEVSSSKESTTTGIYYSARLYRCNTDFSGVSAVFCMCRHHPMYIKCCDRRISETFGAGLSSNLNLVRMKSDEVTLTLQHSDVWNVTFDRNPAKIRKREVDVPELYDFDFSMLTDYPPKLSIFAHSTGVGDDSSDYPQLVVQGLDEECSFQILMPGGRKPDSPSPTQEGKTVSDAMQENAVKRCGTSLNLHCILTELVTINREWNFLGIVLGMAPHVLGEIEANYPSNVKKCMSEVIRKWLETNAGQLSWRTLSEALKSKLVNHPVLAAEIERKYLCDASGQPVSHSYATGPSESDQSLSAPPTKLSASNLAKITVDIRPYSHKWKEIGQGLGFTADELNNIEARPALFASGPSSYLSDMLSDWRHWAPGDTRGSTNYATLESLKEALDKTGLAREAQELHL